MAEANGPHVRRKFAANVSGNVHPGTKEPVRVVFSPYSVLVRALVVLNHLSFSERNHKMLDIQVL